MWLERALESIKGAIDAHSGSAGSKQLGTRRELNKIFWATFIKNPQFSTPEKFILMLWFVMILILENMWNQFSKYMSPNLFWWVLFHPLNNGEFPRTLGGGCVWSVIKKPRRKTTHRSTPVRSLLICEITREISLEKKKLSFRGGARGSMKSDLILIDFFCQWFHSAFQYILTIHQSKIFSSYHQ